MAAQLAVSGGRSVLLDQLESTEDQLSAGAHEVKEYIFQVLLTPTKVYR